MLRDSAYFTTLKSLDYNVVMTFRFNRVIIIIIIIIKFKPVGCLCSCYIMVCFGIILIFVCHKLEVFKLCVGGHLQNVDLLSFDFII